MRHRHMLACLAVAAGCSFNPGAAQQALMQGNMRAFQKDYAGAIGMYDQALASDPGLAEAVFSRGIAYRNRGNYDRALADIGQAVDMGLFGSRILAELARTKLEKFAKVADGNKERLAAAFVKDDPLKVAADLEEAVRLDEFHEDGLAILLAGAVQLMMHDDDAARRYFDLYLLHHAKNRNDLDEAIQKWKTERPVLDFGPIDELGRLPAHGIMRTRY